MWHNEKYSKRKVVAYQEFQNNKRCCAYDFEDTYFILKAIFFSVMRGRGGGGDPLHEITNLSDFQLVQIRGDGRRKKVEWAQYIITARGPSGF